jgi:hypothetical protein
MFTPPVAILRSQAALLASKTDGLVEAFVLSGKRNADLHYQFYLRAPALDNYAYLLLTVVHPVHLYPVTLIAETTGEEYRADSQEQFVEKLRAILSSPETVKVVESLLAQSQELTS